MGVSVTNNLEIRRRVSDDGWVNLSGKYGKFSFSGSLVGQYVNRKADYKRIIRAAQLFSELMRRPHTEMSLILNIPQ